MEYRVFDIVGLKIDLEEYLDDILPVMPRFGVSDDGEILTVNFNVLLENIDDDIEIQLNISSDGLCQFDATLDSITVNEYTLKLINEFNSKHFYMKAYINEDDRLTLNNSFVCRDFYNLKINVNEFFEMLTYLNKNRIFQKLTLMTY